MWNFIVSEIAHRAGQREKMEESASHHLKEAIYYAQVRGKTYSFIEIFVGKLGFPWNFDFSWKSWLSVSVQIEFTQTVLALRVPGGYIT